MKIKKWIIRDVHYTAQQINGLDPDKQYTIVTDHGNGHKTARRVSALAMAQFLAESICNTLDVNVNYDFHQEADND